jgi:hypothetical protein
MNPVSKIEAVRDQAFLKIGRNLTNFQLIESMLKFVVTNARFSSSTSKAKENFARHAKKIQSTSFGELVERFPQALGGPTNEQPDSNNTPRISFSVTSSALPQDILKAFRLELRRIVRDRNQLAHHMLANIDHSSLEAWETLIAELDAQRERTIAVFARVKFLASTVHEVRQAVAENYEAIADKLLSELPPNDSE